MSRPRRNATALIALAAASLTLAACGGDDEQEGTTPATTAADGTSAQTEAATTEQQGGGQPAGPGDEEQVEGAVEALLTDRDNDFVCDEVLTQSLLETAYGDRRGCTRARAPETLARSVEIKSLAGVEGDRVSIVAIPDGGLYDGEKLDVVAVRDGDSWRIDELVADIPVGP